MQRGAGTPSEERRYIHKHHGHKLGESSNPGCLEIFCGVSPVLISFGVSVAVPV